jgi:hypothetical protein
MTETIINHEGDTWRVIGSGTERDGKRYCHLASTTRSREQRNGQVWLQIGDWIEEAILHEAQETARLGKAGQREPNQQQER